MGDRKFSELFAEMNKKAQASKEMSNKAFQEQATLGALQQYATGKMSPATKQEALAALMEAHKLCDKNGVQSVTLQGTNAQWPPAPEALSHPLGHLAYAPFFNDPKAFKAAIATCLPPQKAAAAPVEKAAVAVAAPGKPVNVLDAFKDVTDGVAKDANRPAAALPKLEVAEDVAR